MFARIKVTLPILCSAFLTIALVPTGSLATPTSDWNRHPPVSNLTTNQPESRCQLQTNYLAQGFRTILCQRRLNGTLLRRVQEPGGCFDEIVDIQTGRVLSRRAAPCRRCPV